MAAICVRSAKDKIVRLTFLSCAGSRMRQVASSTSQLGPSSNDEAQHGARFRVDGSMLEGGGQVLRNASALSAITSRPIEIDNIRAGRSTPGLRPQHLTGLQLIAQVCSGTLHGAVKGSTKVAFDPGPLKVGRHVGDTRTAGSCTLLAQATLPCLLYATRGQKGSQSELELRGGTDAAMAPPVGYLQHVLTPTLQRHLKIDVETHLVKRGFYPKGGGVMVLRANAMGAGESLPNFDLTSRGEVSRIVVHAFAAGNLLGGEGEIARAATNDLRRGIGEDVAIEEQLTQETNKSATGTGAGVLILVETSTGLLLGAARSLERGQTFGTIGSQAAQEIIETIHSGACVDQWMQDQLVIFMALAQGKSRYLSTEPTLHARTAMVLAESLTGAKFTVKQTTAPSDGTATQGPDNCWLVECAGAGVVNSTGS